MNDAVCRQARVLKPIYLPENHEAKGQYQDGSAIVTKRRPKVVIKVQ